MNTTDPTPTPTPTPPAEWGALPDSAIPIPGYPGYSITPTGDVWRTTAPKRGPFAGCPLRRVTPSIHPRGHQWYVFVVDESGTRKRVAIRLLLEAARSHFVVDATPVPG